MDNPSNNTVTPWFTEKGLKCACLNINHLICRLDQINLCMQEQKPDIFGICESFLNAKMKDEMLQQQGYVFERKDRVDKGGGGIVCYILEGIKYKRRCDLEEENIENIWLEIIYECSRNILVGIVYRPPGTKIEWHDTFSEHLEKLYHEDKELIIMGDVNIDLLPVIKGLEPSSAAKKLLHILEDVHLSQIICKPTRVTKTSKTLIDHVYVSHPQAIVHSDVPVCAPGDHYPVCVTRKFHKQKENVKQINYRSMRNFDVDCFMSDMFNAPWNLVDKHSSPDEALATWSEIYKSTIDKHMPVVQKRIKHFSQPKWMNDATVIW